VVYVSRPCAFLGLLVLTVFSTFPIRADISTTNVQEQEVLTGEILGPIDGTTGDITLPGGSGILVDANGELIIDAGSLFRADALDSTGTNEITIDQAGSTLEISSTAIVGNGDGSNGSLNLTNGALLDISRGLTIGQNSGLGAATINNSTVALDGTNPFGGVTRIHVGRGADGTLQIENGSTVLVQDASPQLSVGTENFITVGDGVIVGQAGISQQPGAGLPASGFLNIDGAGSRLLIDTAEVGFLTVGISLNDVDSATGTVNVTNGGVIDIPGADSGANNLSSLAIALGENSTGEVRVDGVGSAINLRGALGSSILIASDVQAFDTIGAGTGLLEVTNQSAVNLLESSQGENLFTVGSGAGNGVLDVNTGGIVNINADGTLRISVANGTNNTQTGTVSVSSGGVINVQRTEVGTRGNLLVDGASSFYNVGDELLLGEGGQNGGTANLSVTDGATLTIGGGNESGSFGSGLTIGQGTTAGTATIDNATVIVDRNLNSSGVRLNVPGSGNGTLVIQNGGSLQIQDDSVAVEPANDGIFVGGSIAGVDSTGELTVQGPGSVLTVESANGVFFEIGSSTGGGESAIGVVNIVDGAVVEVNSNGPALTNIVLGRGENANGTLRLSGTGSTLNTIGSVRLGGSSNGQPSSGSALVQVTDQAELDAMNFDVGVFTGNGVVEINTGGVVNVDGRISISDANLNNTGTGMVTVDDTGVLNASQIIVGHRGVLQGTGTIITGLLGVLEDGVANLETLDAVAQVEILGGQLNVSQSFNLGQNSDQNFSLSEGGQFSAVGDSLIGSSGFTSGLTLSDANSLFSITGAASVNTTVAANSGARFQAPGGINVNAGGVLSGDGGTFSTNLVNINTGGRLAPGNSQGTLNIMGDLALNGGELAFEIAGNQPGEFDVLNVDGNLDLNSGTVSVDVLNGFNPEGQSFDVLTATGAFTQSAAVDFVSLGAGPDFSFSTRDVAGVTVGSVDFLAFDIGGLPTLNINQQALGQHLDGLCPQIESLANPSLAQLDLDLRCGGIRNGGNSDAVVQTALDAINPDDIFGTYHQLLGFTTIQHGNLARRLNGLRSGATRINLRNINVRTEDVNVSGEDLQNAVENLIGDRNERWGVFSDGRINFGDQDPSSAVPGFDFDTISFTVGTDYRVKDNLVVGAAFGYNRVDADFDSGGGVDIDAYSLSLIGSYFHKSSFYVDVLASYGLSDVDTTRDIVYQDLLGPIDREATGSTDSDQFTAGLGSGYDFSKGRWVIGPHIGLNFSEIIIDAYDEEGAEGLNLSLPETGVRSLTGNVGLHLSVTTTPSWGVLVPYARLDYVREFQDDTETARVSFANDPLAMSAGGTAPFDVSTETTDDDYVVWSVGMHAQFIRGLAAFADYRGIAGLDDVKLSEVTLGLRFETKF